VRKHLIENTANFDPRKFLKEATNAMSDICAARFEAFGSAGNADLTIVCHYISYNYHIRR
jgi:fructose-bisphosphate aldolase class II